MVRDRLQDHALRWGARALGRVLSADATCRTLAATTAGHIHGFFNACGALKDARDAVTAAGTWALDRLSTRADGARR